MEWACINGRRERAKPKAVAVCPACQSQVIAKCGEVNAWHWAHQAGDCDPWSEGETPWHRNWKGLFPLDWQEVVIEPHRADIKTPKFVVELQHSAINPAMIREREQFYGNMIWLFDLRAARKNVFLSYPDRGSHHLDVPYPLKLFAWKHARRSWFACTKPVLVHLARGELFNVFGFGHYSRLNFRGGFARQLDEGTFMASVGAANWQSADEPFELEAFNALPSPEIARNWQPFWHDERSMDRKTPLFEVRRFHETSPRTIKVLRLPIQY